MISRNRGWALWKYRPVRRSLPGHPKNQGETQHLPEFVHWFEASLDPILLISGDSRIVWVNPQALTLLGYAKNKLDGQPVDQLFSNEAQADGQAAAPVSRVLAGGQPARLDVIARHSDGHDFPAEIIFTPMPLDAQGGGLCHLRDTTPRTTRERELRQQYELMRLMQDVTTAANEASSVAEAFRYVVERLVAFLGWPLGHAFLLDEDQALTPLQVWSGDEMNHFDNFRQVSQSIRFQAGVGLPGLVLESGQPVWASHLAEAMHQQRASAAHQCGLQTAIVLPVLAGKTVVGVLEFFHHEMIPQDTVLMETLLHVGVQLGRVVERKQAEDAQRRTSAQLRMIIRSLPMFLWVIDRTGKLLIIEGKAFSATQLDPATLINQNIFERLPDRSALLSSMQHALTGAEVHTEIASQSGAIFETYLMPYYDDNWAVDGVIGLAFDISERKRMEKNLEEIKHRLLNSIDSERAHLARQLHDGPLQDLYGIFYQVQEVHGLVDSSSPAQEIIQRVLATIQEINANLRIIVGELHPNTLIHLGLEKAIRSHADRLQDQHKDTQIHLDLNDVDLALAEPERLALFRIYQQLINNAIDHAQASHVWARLWQQNEAIALEVQDNGQGFTMPEQWIELVRQGKLGLANALERVEWLGGEMEIHSAPGRGTTVRVTVPRKKD